MAIQIPNPGTGNPVDQTGDTEWVAVKKLADNFSDQSNAASRLLGTSKTQVPLAKDAFKAAAIGDWSSSTDGYTTTDDFPIGSQFLINTNFNQILGMPSKEITGINIWGISTVSTGVNAAERMQIAVSNKIGWEVLIRIKIQDNVYSEWMPVSYSKINYARTTALGANVVIDATGKLMRSTSSERYKDIIGDLALDDATYNNAMSLAPIIYRSTADADNPLHHHYSFSAEALGAFDKAFTFWRFTEQVEDAEGNITDQPLVEPVAEGININALLAFSHAIAIKQHRMISKQQAKIDALDARLKALEPKPEA